MMKQVVKWMGTFLCLSMLTFTRIEAKAQEGVLTPTVASVVLENGQFQVCQTVAQATAEEVAGAVSKANEQLLTQICQGPNMAYDMASGVYVRYDSPVVYQFNQDFVPYLLEQVEKAQLAEEAEIAYALNSSKAATGDEQLLNQYNRDRAFVAAVNDALTFGRDMTGTNQVVLRVSARYLTAYPLDQSAVPQVYCLAGEKSTSYVGSTLDRIENLKLASKALSERIVLPGETVSCSDSFGPRTAANGYKNASVFQNGQKVDGIGGGICQVTTTLYNALMGAGVTVTERHPHSMQVDYVPMGMDSAISQGVKDLVFRNDYRQPIYIQSEVYKAYINCRVYVPLQEIGDVRYELVSKATGKLSTDTYLRKLQGGQELEVRYVDSSKYYK